MEVGSAGLSGSVMGAHDAGRGEVKSRVRMAPKSGKGPDGDKHLRVQEPGEGGDVLAHAPDIQAGEGDRVEREGSWRARIPIIFSGRVGGVEQSDRDEAHPEEWVHLPGRG